MAIRSARRLDEFNIDGYRLEEVIGEGSSGVVYRAYASGNHTHHVAVKISKQKIGAESVENRIRFENEAELLAKLSHPSIVKLQKIGFSEGHFYLVMELVQGEPFDRYYSADILTKAEVLRQVASGLAHSHARRIVHRDIKPSNILVSLNDGKVAAKILDFGLSSLSDSRQVGAGTLLYLAPEQLGSSAQIGDERSDLYSLGMVAAELFNGGHPFRGLGINELIDAQVSKTPELPENLPASLLEIIRVLLKKDPAQRYETAKGVAADLQIFIERYRSGEQGSFELRRQDRAFKLNSPKFLGRLNERNAFAASLEKAKTGELAIVLLDAPSGTGKSRLIGEVARKWKKNLVLWGVGRAYGQSSAYGMFTRVLRELVDSRPTTDLQERLRNSVGERGAEIVRLVPEMADVLGNATDTTELEPERRQQRFFTAMTNLLRELASIDNPLVLVFDDIQWADEGSLQLMLHLASQGRSLPLLMVLAYRTDEVPEGSRIHQFLQKIWSFKSASSIKLGPLTNDEICALTFSMLGKQIADVEQIITAQAHGSPLFAIELLYAMVESSAIEASDAGWIVNDLELLKTYALNDSLAKTIAKRFERLLPETRTILQLAAVAGRVFKSDVVIRAAQTKLKQSNDQSARAFVTAIQEASEARLVSLISESEGYEFCHDKIRESLYDGLQDQERRGLHRLIGLAIETLNERSSKSTYELAHHFILSDDRSLAARFAIEAGKLACRHHAYREAIDFFEFVESITGEVSLTGKERNDFWEFFADSASMTGDFDLAMQKYQLLLQTLEEKSERAAILGKMGKTMFAKGEAFESCRLLELALAAYGEKIPSSMPGFLLLHVTEVVKFLWRRITKRQTPISEDVTLRGIAKIYSQLCYVYYFLDSIKTSALHFRHLNFVETHNIRSELAQVYSNHGMAAIVFQLPDRGVRYGLRSLALREAQGDRWGIAQSQQFLALICGSRAEWTQSLERGRAAEAEFSRLGDQWELATTNVILGSGYFNLGDWERAEHYANKSHDIAASIKHNTGLSFAAHVRSEIASRLDPAEVLDEINAILAIVEKAGDRFATCLLYHGKGKCYLYLGKIDEADQEFQKGIAIIEKYFVYNDYVVACYLGHIEALLLKFDQETNQVKRKQLLREAKTTTNVATMAAMTFSNYKCQIAHARAMIAVREGNVRRADRYWRRALDFAVLYGLKFYQGHILKEWGKSQVSRNRSHGEILLRQSYGIFRDLRAKFELRELADVFGTLGIHVEAEHDMSTGRQLSQRGHSSSSLSMRNSSADRERGAILNIGLASVSSANPVDQINSMLDEVVQLMAADRAYLFVLNKKSNELEFSAGRNSSKVSLLQTAGFSASAVKEANTKSEVVLINSNDARMLASESVVAHDLKSIIAVPLKIRDVITGILYLDSSITNGLFSNEDAEILSMISGYLAIAIESSHLASLEVSRREMLKDLETKQAVQTILDNLDQGFMTVNSEGKVLQGVSKAAHALFGMDPQGKPISEILRLNTEQTEKMHRWISMLFMDQVPFESLLPLGVRTLEANSQRYITLDYRPIRSSEDKLEKVIVVATDRTAERALRDQAEAEASFARMVVSILRDKTRFASFLKSLNETIELIEQMLVKPVHTIDLTALLRGIHTAKGGAAMYYINSIKEPVHKLELLLTEGAVDRTSDHHLGVAVPQLADHLAKVREAISRFLAQNRVVMKKLVPNSETTKEVAVSDLQWTAETLTRAYGADSEKLAHFYQRCLGEAVGAAFEPFDDTVSQIARKQHKKVKLKIDESPIKLVFAPYRVLFESLVHAFRNAVDHGVETPDERRAVEKPNEAIIQVSFQTVESSGANWLRITISDDGRGIDAKVISRIAIARGLVTPSALETMSEEEILQFVFASGLSTRKSVTDVSGQGIGLEAVMFEAKRLGGRARISSQLGQGTTLTIEVPAELRTLPV